MLAVTFKIYHMADDQKNFNPLERNTKEKKNQQTRMVAKKNATSNFFTSRNKGKKVLHIGVKH